MLAEWILNRLAPPVGLVITGREFILTTQAPDASPVIVPDWYTPPPPAKLPDAMPAEARQGLTTRRHINPPQPVRTTCEGLLGDFEAVEGLLKSGVRTLLGRRFIGPPLIAASRNCTAI